MSLEHSAQGEEEGEEKRAMSWVCRARDESDREAATRLTNENGSDVNRQDTISRVGDMLDQEP
jgi:hypothetical protein